MKQLLFLLLFPCFAIAQYQGNGNQKITLGEQTTADGLVYRGVASIDTVTATSKITRANKQDTSAYILLDTVTNLLWHYKIGSNAWTQAGGSTLDTATMLLPYWRSGRFSGVLPVANGGTNLTTFTAANRIPYASSATALTTTNKFTFDSNGNKLIIGKNDSLDSNPNYTINLSGSDTPAPVLGFRLYNTTLNKVSIFRYDNNHSFVFANNDADNGLGAHRFRIGSGSGEEILTITRPTPSGTDGRVGIGTASPSEKLHVVGNGLFTGSVTANSLSLTTPLPVANGGTGSTTQNFVDLTTTQSSIAGKKTFTTGIATTANVDGDPEAFTLSNTSTGTSAESTLYVRNESNNNASIFFQTVGTNFTSVGGFLNDQGTIGTGTALSNGMAIMVRAAADMRFYTSGHTNERMRITSTGNVGIGTTSPTARLHVKGSTPDGTASAFKIDNSGNTNLLNILNNGVATFRNISNSGAPATSGTTVNATLSIDNAFSVMTNIGNLSASPYSVWLQVQDKGNLAITYPLSLQPNGGNVGIGTTSPSEKFHVDGNGLFTGNVTATRFDPTANTVTGNGMYLPATNSLGFSTAGTQRIHINSAGKVGIGTQMTTAGTNDYGTLNVNGRFTFENEFLALRASGDIDHYLDFFLREAGTSGNFGTGETGQFEFYSYSASNTIGALVIGMIQSRPVIFGTNSLERVRVKGDGEMNIGYGATDNGAYLLQINGQPYATSALFVPSDENYKENITPLNKGIEIVNKLKPVTFNFISDTKNNFSEYEEVGFIAQDVDRALSTETFAKSIVKSADDSEPTAKMGLMTQNLIPILVKAIQEQQTLIKALEQRILILENK